MIESVLGRGAYGVVYKGRHTETGAVVAIKSISIRRCSREQIEAVLTEIDLLKQLNSEYIVSYIGHKRTRKSLYIYIEYVPGGSLQDLLRRQPPNHKGLPESKVCSYIYQIIRALQYVHSEGVIHRDIKGANILIDANDKLKLADFGVASDFREDADTNPAGTPYWMAPEVVQFQYPNPASDIWSVGATAVELLTGCPPYFNLPTYTALYRIAQDTTPPIPTNVELSETCKRFLLVCFERDVRKRPTAEDLLSHRWFRDVRDSGSLRIMRSGSSGVDTGGDISSGTESEGAVTAGSSASSRSSRHRHRRHHRHHHSESGTGSRHRHHHRHRSRPGQSSHRHRHRHHRSRKVTENEGDDEMSSYSSGSAGSGRIDPRSEPNLNSVAAASNPQDADLDGLEDIVVTDEEDDFMLSLDDADRARFGRDGDADFDGEREVDGIQEQRRIMSFFSSLGGDASDIDMFQAYAKFFEVYNDPEHFEHFERVGGVSFLIPFLVGSEKAFVEQGLLYLGKMMNFFLMNKEKQTEYIQQGLIADLARNLTHLVRNDREVREKALDLYVMMAHKKALRPVLLENGAFEFIIFVLEDRQEYFNGLDMLLNFTEDPHIGRSFERKLVRESLRLVGIFQQIQPKQFADLMEPLYKFLLSSKRLHAKLSLNADFMLVLKRMFLECRDPFKRFLELKIIHLIYQDSPKPKRIIQEMYPLVQEALLHSRRRVVSKYSDVLIQAFEQHIKC